MRIVFSHTEPGPVGWLRAWQWGRALAARGHEVWMRPDESEQIIKANVDVVTKGADVVVCGRTHDAETFALLMAARHLYGFKLVVDTDDDVEAVPDYAHSFNEWHSGGSLRRLARGEYREADLVTVSTAPLAETVGKHAKQVVVVPNCIDPTRYQSVKFRQKEARHASDIRIYWGGGANHYADLLLVKDVLLSICRDYPQVKLVFSNFLPDWAVEALPANRCFMVKVAQFDEYPRVLSWICADIAIAPLADNRFNRAKSNIKYLDYAMARIPGVYQRLDPYACVRHGETGMVAGDAAEWDESLRLLLRDPSLRLRTAVRARGDVRAYEIDRHVGRYEQILRELIVDRPTEGVVALTEGEPISYA